MHTWCRRLALSFAAKKSNDLATFVEARLGKPSHLLEGDKLKQFLAQVICKAPPSAVIAACTDQCMIALGGACPVLRWCHNAQGTHTHTGTHAHTQAAQLNSLRLAPALVTEA